MPVKIHRFVFNDFLENTYVVWDETSECIIVDAGCFYENEREDLEKFISGKNLKPSMLLNTHAHIDHVFGLKWAKEKFKVPFALNSKELKVLNTAQQVGSFYGIMIDPPPAPDIFYEAGDEVSFGKTKLKTFFTPGHSPGSISFYHPENKLLLSGDVLFQQSIGRTDLPGGNYQTLMESIMNELMPLPDETIVYSGHGPETTIGEERRNNPFILEYMQEKVKS